MSSLTIIQASALGFLIASESVVSYLYNLGLYEKKDTMDSISIGLISMLIIFSTTGVFLTMLLFISRFSFFDLGYQWYSWFALFIICDISYYLIHLLSHKVRFFWASHMLHHSSHLLNYSTVLRGPVFYLSFRMVFWIPMVLIGFPPAMIIVTDTIIQLYTVATHTRMVRKLGVLEYIFNTPNHHRLHHGLNPQYMDKNFAGVLIVWDRMFGTFVEQNESPVFGLEETRNIHNPAKLILMEWSNIYQDFRSARTFSGKQKAIFGRPNGAKN